jgi:hypothetical protein
LSGLSSTVAPVGGGPVIGTGALLGSTTADLQSAGKAEAATVTLDLSASEAVRFRVEALLDPGERWVVDALGVTP